MNYASYIAWIPLLPLAGFVLLGLFGRRYIRNFSGIIGTAILLAMTLFCLIMAWQYFLVDGKSNGVYRSMIPIRFAWLPFYGNLSIDLSIVLDPLSVMMLVVVSFVSLMVHLFSLGYMKGEERFSTYYAFLSLFTFSMTGLVLSANLFETYIFWELVGLSSYLLIGFYFDRPSAVAASQKAFVVTRFADLGFLAGILILSFYAGSLDFQTLISRLGSPGSPQFLGISTHSFLGISALSWGLILVFIGGAGKSAMFPLHIWLPDAMEGPTPVSALIHAATMVVAGVYLVARLFFLYATDPGVLQVIAYTGAFSAIFAAIIACTQTDIKRILAYSTMSQIGYMLFALGVSGYGDGKELGYSASLFHLFTHAFFKSLLFLCAGSVIHRVHTNDMREMGGLRKQMPLTHLAFLIACLAISGIPPFSGFFSKEEILSAAYGSNRLIYGIGLISSLLTAFYMFRMYFTIFHHKTPGAGLHGKPDGIFMRIPLVLLSLSSLFAGFIPFSRFVTADHIPRETLIEPVFTLLPIGLSITGILVAARLFYKKNALPEQIAGSLGAGYRLAYRKFYIDEVYLFITRKIIYNLIGRPAAWIDKHIIDGFMNLLAALTTGISERIKGLQSGRVQAYALYFFAGALGLALVFIYLWKTP